MFVQCLIARGCACFKRNEINLFPRLSLRRESWQSRVPNEVVFEKIARKTAKFRDQAVEQRRTATAARKRRRKAAINQSSNPAINQRPETGSTNKTTVQTKTRHCGTQIGWRVTRNTHTETDTESETTTISHKGSITVPSTISAFLHPIPSHPTALTCLTITITITATAPHNNQKSAAPDRSSKSRID